jgi:hypothetical protein
MKTIKMIFTMLMLVSVTILINSCGGDDPKPETLPPTLQITQGTSAQAERGQTVDLTLTFISQGGAKTLTANGTAVTITPGALEGTLTYSIAVPATAPFGTPLVTQFIFTDNENREALATFTINLIGSTVNLSSLATGGIINTTVSLEAENSYILDIPITVQDGGILNIEAGTTIRAKTAAIAGGVQKVNLIIAATGKINAIGTSSNPIVFTSDKTSPAPGDWQGLRINGTSTNPDQGTLRYVRIEYGGRDQVNVKEAALRISGVRSPTKIEFVQVFKSDDEGIKYRDGSTVHLNNIVITDCNSRHLHVRDAATAGTFQFVVIQVRNLLNLVADDGTTEAAPFEIRDAAGTISNFTILGPGLAADGGADGLRHRPTAVSSKMFNGLIAEFPDDGARVGKATITDINGDPVLAHSYIFRIDDTPTRDDSGAPLAFETNAVAFNNTIDADNVPSAAAGISVDSYVPTALIPSTFVPTTLGATFLAGSYVGAIGATDWTAGGWVRNPSGTIRQ